MDDLPPDVLPSTVHKRFAFALLREALAGAGTVHLDYRVENEPQWIHGWAPRRSANDPEPPHPPNPDPQKRLGQGILAAAMDAAGMVPHSVLAGTEPTFLDFYFEPDASGVPAPGLLGRMTSSPSILAPFHAPPGEPETHDAMRRALNLWEMQGREAKKTRAEEREAKRPEMAETWMICATPSEVLQDGFGFKPRSAWPLGIYFGPPALAMQAIFLHELPATRATLLLRLLGAGDVLENALTEQAALPEEAVERRATRAALLAVSTPEDPVPIDEAARDPVLHACRRIYRRWAQDLDA